jgi:hypothetical protein
VRAPPDNGGGRDAPRRPGRNTSTTTTPLPSETLTIVIVAQQADRVVVDLATARQRRVERVDLGSGPYWPSWRCCWSWTTAEASRRAG